MSLQALVTQCLGERDALELARQQAGQWDAWLLPISADTPVGADPGYDDDFQQMREEVNTLSGADTGRVVVLAERLFKQRCKDLRVAGYYLWARLQMDGEAGLAAGLSLLAALLERYAQQVLPERPNSRRQALQWLTSSKVLDSLALYPRVPGSAAENTVAALVWLEQGLQTWPEAQRPGLDNLYTALATRLSQSAGPAVRVSQNTVGGEPTVPTSRPAPLAIRSGRDLLDSGRTLTGYLREQPQGWLAAHRLMKCLRWDTLQQAPPPDASGNTRLAPPRGDYRVQLKRLHGQQNWNELLEQAERMFAEGVNHFWLDLQWYLYQALGKQSLPESGWAPLVRQDLAMLLERLPGLEVLCWSNGTPFADETTREWISREVCARQPQAWLPSPVETPATGDAEIFALEGEALALADRDGAEQALAWLAARPGMFSGRQRWLLRLLMARVAEQYGKHELALHLLSELESGARRRGLGGWEPELDFEVKARLLRLLRARAQRGEADRSALAARTDALLAGLVAIDPVRAAVFCG